MKKGKKKTQQKKQNPPHSTKANKQGHPNFSIRAPREGQEMDQFSFAPTIPLPCRANFGGEKEIYGVQPTRIEWLMTSC